MIYPVKAKIMEKKKRIYENAVKGRRFGVFNIDYDMLDKVWKAKSMNIISGSVK